MGKWRSKNLPTDKNKQSSSSSLATEAGVNNENSVLHLEILLLSCFLISKHELHQFNTYNPYGTRKQV